MVKFINWTDKDSSGKKTYRTLIKPCVLNHSVYDPKRPEQVDE